MHYKSSIPLVYIAGKPPAFAFSIAQDMDMIEKIEHLSVTNNISMYKLSGTNLCTREFCVMKGRNHPSAHYYYTERGRNEFKDTIGIINDIAKSFKRVNGIISEVTENDMDSDKSATTGISEEYLKNRRDANVFMTELLYERNDGWFEKKHIHLRHLPAHREDIQLFLKSWKQDEHKLLNIIMIHGTACRLDKDGFMDQLIQLRRSFNDHKLFVTFMCNSIACRLNKDGFMDQLIQLRQPFEDEKLFVTFMCGGIACRLEKDGFMDQLIQLRRSFNDDKLFVTFMCNSITCRLEKDGFMDQLIQLRRSFNDDKLFVTFMCNSIACRLEKDGCMDQLIKLRQFFNDNQQFVTFMCDSITCRLEKAGFMDQLLEFRRSFNDEKLFVTFMCDSIACRLENEGFMDKLIQLHRSFEDDLSSLSLLFLVTER
jgi:methyl coenzyme M reductase gamma subunit